MLIKDGASNRKIDEKYKPVEPFKATLLDNKKVSESFKALLPDNLKNAAVLNTSPKFQSELYDKMAEAKKLSVDNPVYQTDKITSMEKGALLFLSPKFSAKLEDAVTLVKQGKSTIPTKQQIARNKLKNFRASDEFNWASDVIKNTDQQVLVNYELLKQGSQLRDSYVSASAKDKPAIARQLYDVTNQLQKIENVPWQDGFAYDNDVMNNLLQTIGRYEADYGQLGDAEAIIAQGEQLQKEADWIFDAFAPYKKMDPIEQSLFEQDVLLSFQNGRKAIDFDMMEEHLAMEQFNADLYGPTGMHQQGTQIAAYKTLADKQRQELTDYRDVLLNIQQRDYGRLGEKGQKAIAFEIQYIDQQLKAVEGFEYRYETPDILEKSAEGEKQWYEDNKFNEVIMSRDHTYGEKTLPGFDAKWKKKLAENPGDKELEAQYDFERKVLVSEEHKARSLDVEIAGAKGTIYDNTVVELMTEQERQTFFAYYIDNKDKAHEYAMALRPTANKRAAFYTDEALKKLASGDLFDQGKAGITSVISTIGQVIAPFYIVSSELRGEAIDPYAAAFGPGRGKQVIREQLKENTKAAYGEDSFTTKALTFGQDVLFSNADSIVGGKVLGFTGYMVSSSSDVVSSTLLNGGTQDQALAMWAASTFAEAATEKPPFDNLMGAFKKGVSLRGLAVAVGGEALGESMSSLLGNAADRSIMLDKSAYETSVRAYKNEQHMTQEEAEKQAMEDILKSALYDGAVGGVSGGVSYGVAGITNAITSKKTNAEVDAIRSADGPDELSSAVAGVMAGYQSGQNAPTNPVSDQQRAKDLQERAAEFERQKDERLDPGYQKPEVVAPEVETPSPAVEQPTLDFGEYRSEENQPGVPAFPKNAPVAEQQAQAGMQGDPSVMFSAQEQRLEQALQRQYAIESVPVSEIQVSPQDYQFKANVDDVGVHNRIEGEYVPAYAGTVVVHERADGSRYIADGHHRLDRAIQSGIESLQAIILRESEGVSTALARAFAAARNIASSRGTSVDAAKVFRETGVQQQDLYQLGLSPNERNVQEGIALAQVDDALFERIAQEEIPVKAGVMMGEVFPGDPQMQREYWRKVAGRNMTGDAMLELAMNLKNAQQVAASQEQIGFDFLDSPALTNAAEKAEVAARVKNMIGRLMSTFKSLSGGKRVDQVAAVGENVIDTQANSEQVSVSQEAASVMQTYWASDSPAFDIINDLASAYAEGKTTLAKAAEQAYTAVMQMAKDTLGSEKLTMAMAPVSNAVQVLVGNYGADPIGHFYGRLLEAVDGTDYAAQQRTMNNLAQVATLPAEAPSKGMLDEMVHSNNVTVEALGAFNQVAEQDIANPAYDDARASLADEVAIAQLTAREIANGALADIETRNIKLNDLRAKTEQAAATTQAAQETLSESLQELVRFTEDTRPLTPDVVAQHKALMDEIEANRAAVRKAEKNQSTLETALRVFQQNFDQDYVKKLGEIRARSVNALQTALNIPTSPSTPLDDTNLPQQAEAPVQALEGQIQAIDKMYTGDAAYLAAVESGETDSEGRALSVGQQEYFKDSKVRDDTGKLIPVYHGTNADFTVFDRNKIGDKTDPGWFGKGFYFHIDKDTAGVYGKNTLPVYLNAKNVWDINKLAQDGNKTIGAVIDDAIGPDPVGTWGHRDPRTEAETAELITDFLVNNGYDGVAVWGQRMVMSPDQIKEVTNLTPTSSPDIRYSYFVSQGGLPVSAPDTQSKGPVKSAQTIFTELGKAIGVPFNTNRRQYNRNLRKNTAGYFVTKGEAVHVKNAQDLTAAAHEFGHFLDKRLRVGSHPVIADIVGLLKQNPAFAKNYTNEQMTGEAVAEATKMYMVNRNQAIAQLGADFVSQLESGMREIGALDAFNKARQQLERLIGAKTAEQIKARIVKADEASKRTAGEKLLDFRVKALDSTLAFDPISRRLRQEMGRDYRAEQDPRAIALKNNRIDNFVRDNFESALVDMKGDRILDQGFADNFDGIKNKDYKDFNAYLLAYHEIDRARAGKSIFGGQYTTEQLQQVIREYEAAHPDWRAKKADLHEWYDSFMQEYLVNTGILSAQEYATMHAMYPNYVPTYRQMEGAKGVGKGKDGDIKAGLMRAVGGDQNVKSPIESMAQLVIKYTQQAHRLQLANTFADYIDNHDATGMFAERIQKDVRYNPEVEAIKQKIEAMTKNKQSFDPENPDTWMLDEGEAALGNFQNEITDLVDKALFSLSDTASGANVINVLGKDGNYRSYVVHDQNMFNLLQQVPGSKMSAVLQATGKIVRLISATATGTNPFFALTNGVRDLTTQMIYGTTSTNFLTAVPKWLANIPRTLMGVLSNTTVNGKQLLKDNRYTEAYRLYSLFSETGGRYTAQIGKSSDAMVEAITKPGKPKRAAKGALKLVTMQSLNEIVENNTRFLEFYSGKSSMGKNRKNLDTFEGRLRAGLAAAGVTVDFKRSGSSVITKEIAALVPFFNAGIQGINKAASVLTNENAGRRPQIIAKVALNMTLLGVMQAVLNNRDLTDEEKEEYESFDEGFKAKNMFVKVGNEHLLRIPMPQDLIATLSFAIGRIIGSAVTGEGNSVADDLVGAAKAILSENLSFSTVYSPIQNLIENRTWYGSTIETEYMQDNLMKQERYNERTTEVAKWLGQNLGGLSPVQWDYIIPQYTGVWGKLGGNFLRNLSGEAGVGEAFVETINKELASRFFTTPAYTSQLYNNYKASLDEFAKIGGHYKADRPFIMFDPNLTQDELNTAVAEAKRMTLKGGQLYNIDQKISAKWDEYNVILNNETLTDAQQEEQVKTIRQDINMLALEGQNIIADYEAKYFPGNTRSNQATIKDGVKNLGGSGQLTNIRDMRAQGVEEAAAMNDVVYEDLQAGKTYAKVLTDLAGKWDKPSIAGVEPSFNWSGFDANSMTEDERRMATEAYSREIERGVNEQSSKLKAAGSVDEVDKIMGKIKDKATDQAQRAVMGEDGYYARLAPDYMKTQIEHNTVYSQQSLDVSKKWDTSYMLNTKPSLTWKGFDKEAATPEKLEAIEEVYYDWVADGLNKRYNEILSAPTFEAAKKIMESITGKAAAEAKKVALRK